MNRQTLKKVHFQQI